MNAYSKDLRLRVLDAVDRGLPRKEVSELFGVSHSTIKHWVKRRREGEDLEPKRSTGRKRRILSTTEEKWALWKQLQENDEATLERHCELWESSRGLDPRRFVFVDESSTNVRMVPIRARAPKGERAFSCLPTRLTSTP